MGLYGSFLSRTDRVRNQPRLNPERAAYEGGSSSSKRQLNPKFAGNYLIHQLLISKDSKFGLTRDEIKRLSQDLPSPIRELFPFWAGLYSAWMFRIGAGVTYGNEFQVEMMAHAFARIENSGGFLTNTQDFTDPVRAVFGLLDDLMVNHYKNPPIFDGKEMPFCVRAAAKFLLTTEGSPFFNNPTATDGKTIFALAESLARVEDHARSFAPAALKRAAESAEEF